MGREPGVASGGVSREAPIGQKGATRTNNKLEQQQTNV